MGAVSPDLSKVPPFLCDRMRGFYIDRVQNDWEGRLIMQSHFQPDGDAIQLCSNDYLALAQHPEILKAQAGAVLEHGNGILQSGVFLANRNLVNSFEEDIADFLKAPQAILCQSGWNANVGLLQSIAAKHVPVYVDILAHKSLWEGVRSAEAKRHFFRHNDVVHLERKIHQHGPGIVVIDSIYSTNGNIAPIKEIVDVATQHGCVMVVDESHSLGTHGPQGEGLVVELGLEDAVHFRTASLAKAFAGRAGVITCSEEFFYYLLATSQPSIFSSAMLPHEIVGLSKTLEIIRKAEDRRKQLHANADRLRHGLSELGYNVDDSDSQIISIEPGLERMTINARDVLEEHGVFGSVFCAPATSRNRSLIRLSMNSAITNQQIEKVLYIFSKIRDRIQLKDWASTSRKSMI